MQTSKTIKITLTGTLNIIQVIELAMNTQNVVARIWELLKRGFVRVMIVHYSKLPGVPKELYEKKLYVWMPSTLMRGILGNESWHD